MGARLAKAPVYFTVAQIRHNPVLSINDYIPALQEQMRREGYPDYKQIMNLQFALSTPGETPQNTIPTLQQTERYLFSTLDATSGFIVDSGAFSFQTTEYETYGVFSEAFFKGLKILHETVKLNYTERMGIRYLDVIVPAEGKEISEYLIPGALGIAPVLPASVQVAESFSQTQISSQAGNVVAKVIVRIGPLGFPIDLQPMGIRVADRFSKINKLHAILDTDAYNLERAEINMETLQSRLQGLHKTINLVFRATVTEKARKEWAEPGD